jgi:hypothetical protein
MAARYISTYPKEEVAGAKKGVFWENNQTLSSSYTITTGTNAGTFGAITIASGVAVTIPSGSTWTIV